ncbi:hypothetical protein [Thiocystis violascens]|uniref:hypothetical protein n=1 Tax=Thiocystis violascens TaxID=73141 RepID=UPI00059D75F5|nr:hypothetical protein [Thiocystis violascens]
MPRDAAYFSCRPFEGAGKSLAADSSRGCDLGELVGAGKFDRPYHAVQSALMVARIARKPGTLPVLQVQLMSIDPVSGGVMRPEGGYRNLIAGQGRSVLWRGAGSDRPLDCHEAKWALGIPAGSGNVRLLF